MSMQLEDIPVRIENTTEGIVSAQVQALLLEMQNMLQALRERGECNVIDIRSLPMLPGDLERLKELLGSGEVEATVYALGPTLIKETQVPGIWWVTHKNAYDEILSEVIEVTTLPDILVTQHQDLQYSVDILQRRIEEVDFR